MKSPFSMVYPTRKLFVASVEKGLTGVFAGNMEPCMEMDPILPEMPAIVTTIA